MKGSSWLNKSRIPIILSTSGYFKMKLSPKWYRDEFKKFVTTFKYAMRDLEEQVKRIADNTDDLSSIMKNQSETMRDHFEKAALDREMASELTKQHRHWERYIGEVGK